MARSTSAFANSPQLDLLPHSTKQRLMSSEFEESNGGKQY